MFETNGGRILLGDFHTHWYWDKENPTCYLAGMKSMGLDFALLCDGWKRGLECDALAQASNSGFRFFAAKELTYDFAHIVVLLDDPAKEAELRVKSGAPTPEEAFKRAKELSALVVFAHPGRNWSAAYDGKSFAPIARLIEKGLVDAVQAEKPEIYAEIAALLGKEPPSVGGIDCHACDRLEPLPPWLYGAETPVFKHIRPCGQSSTALLCEANTPEAVVKAVKSGLSASFDFETMELTGPSEAKKRIEEAGFKELWQERKRKRDAVKISCSGMLAGARGRIEIEAQSAISLAFPSSTAPGWRFEKAVGSSIETPPIPAFNKRDADYYPLAVGFADGQTEIYAILAKKAVTANLEWLSEALPNGSVKRLARISIENNSATQIEAQASISGALEFKSPKRAASISSHSKAILDFEALALERPGCEYGIIAQAAIAGGETIQLEAKASFPLCRRLEKGASPWRHHDAPAILCEKSQAMALTGPLDECWKGPHDLSAKLSLWWDDAALHLFAEVEDSQFFQKWIDWETFWGDSIQFAIDPGKARARGYGSNYEFAAAFTCKGPELMLWYSPEHGSEQVRELCPDVPFKFERDEEAKRSFYKISFPWNRLAPLKPAQGASFNFMLLVNDNDGTVLNRKCVLFYGGNLGELKDTSKAHEIVLC